MVFSLLPILSLLVSGVEVDENDESTLLQVVVQVKFGSDGHDDGGSVATRSLGDEAPVELQVDGHSVAQGMVGGVTESTAPHTMAALSKVEDDFNCIAVNGGETAPLPGFFSFANGSVVNLAVSLGDVSPAAGNFCLEEQALGLFQRSVSHQDRGLESAVSSKVIKDLTYIDPPDCGVWHMCNLLLFAQLQRGVSARLEMLDWSVYKNPVAPQLRGENDQETEPFYKKLLDLSYCAGGAWKQVVYDLVKNQTNQWTNNPRHPSKWLAHCFESDSLYPLKAYCDCEF